MPIPPIHFASAAESLDELLKRIADRDQAAFGRFYRRLVRPVFAQVRESLGSSAHAVPVTRAVFVDVWRLAPIHRAQHDDVLAWVRAIAVRRADDRLRELGHRPPSTDGGYEGQLGRKLVTTLQAGPPDTVSGPAPARALS
jgi:DNA-directed RNA polymerase specialized sigma24 family protein